MYATYSLILEYLQAHILLNECYNGMQILSFSEWWKFPGQHSTFRYKDTKIYFWASYDVQEKI